MKNKIIVLGSANKDTFLRTIPKIGETVSAHTIVSFTGGKGANQAAAAALMNCPTTFVAQLGNDSCCNLILKDLKDRKVNVEHVALLDDTPTGQAFITLREDGANSIVIVGGANTNWNEAKFETYFNSIGQEGDILLMQREIPDSINLIACKIAKKKSKIF